MGVLVDRVLMRRKVEEGSWGSRGREHLSDSLKTASFLEKCAVEVESNIVYKKFFFIKNCSFFLIFLIIFFSIHRFLLFSYCNFQIIARTQYLNFSFALKTNFVNLNILPQILVTFHLFWIENFQAARNQCFADDAEWKLALRDAFKLSFQPPRQSEEQSSKIWRKRSSPIFATCSALNLCFQLQT